MQVLHARICAWHVGSALLHGAKSNGPVGPALTPGCVCPAAPDACSSCRESSPFIARGRKLLPLHHQRVQFSALPVPYLCLNSGQCVFNSTQWAFRDSLSTCRENVNNSDSRTFGKVSPPQQALFIYALIFVDYSELLSSSPESPR